MHGISDSGTDRDFFAYDSTGKVWDGSAFVTPVAADYLDYRIAATGDGLGNFSAAAPSGTVRYELRVRGATLADSYVVWSESPVTDLADIKAKTDLIGTGSAVVSAPVSGDGDLLELILETDYLAANGRALEWTFDEIPGITTSAVGHLGIALGTEDYLNTSGVVTDLGGGRFKVSFDIPNTAIELSPGEADWSVDVVEGGTKITVARNRQRKTRVHIVEKQT